MTAASNPGTLADVFTDLELRFLSSLSRADFERGSERVFFQIEQAWWRYEDSLADNFEHLPHYKKFETFAREMFKRSPLLSHLNSSFDELYRRFKDYQHRIPVYGAALLTTDLRKVLLVTSFYGKATWGFPKGKVNQGEDKLACALREVYEEVGYDARHLSPDPRNQITVNSKNGKVITIFVIPGVEEGFNFKPHVVKEIGEIKWHELDALPSNSSMRKAAEAPAGKPEKYWGVAPFIPQLRKWIAQKKQSMGIQVTAVADDEDDVEEEEDLTEEDFAVDWERVRQAMAVHLIG